jgi:ribulose-bisphosphate carboxylase large chain
MASSETIQDAKERYKSGVIPYKKMGYWEPDYQPNRRIILLKYASLEPHSVLLHTVS